MKMMGERDVVDERTRDAVGAIAHLLDTREQHDDLYSCSILVRRPCRRAI
jgi:hypothetical protein